MKLYFTKGACSLVERIICNELQLNCSYEAVDLKTKKTATGKDFLKINSKGAVPALELDNGVVLTENAVILQYLADTHAATRLLPALGNFERYKVLEWLNYMATEVHKGFGALFNPSVPQQLKDELFIPMLKAKFKYLNRHLQLHPYLSGEQFTLPDAYLFVMLLWAGQFKLDLKEYVPLSNYFTNLKKRQSIHQALDAEQIAL